MIGSAADAGTASGPRFCWDMVRQVTGTIRRHRPDSAAVRLLAKMTPFDSVGNESDGKRRPSAVPGTGTPVSGFNGR